MSGPGFYVDPDDVPHDAPIGAVVQLPEGDWAVRVREQSEPYDCGLDCCGWFLYEWEGFASEAEARKVSEAVR